MNASQYKGGNKGRPTFLENSPMAEVINSFSSLKYASLVDDIRNSSTDAD